MKKFIVVLASICLVFGAVGNAAAYFDYNLTSPQSSLGLSIYNPNTNVENGYDLGTLGGGLDLAAQGQVLFTGVDVSDTAATVALYSANMAWQSTFGLTTETATGVNSSNLVGFKNAVRDVFNFGYGHDDPSVTVDAATQGAKTANNLFQYFGNYQGIVSGGNSLLQPNLSDLATDGFVDIFVYVYDGITLNKGFDATTDYAATITIFGQDMNGYEAGDVVLNAVPIPGALVLVCTGLLGMLGITRKRA